MVAGLPRVFRTVKPFDEVEVAIREQARLGTPTALGDFGLRAAQIREVENFFRTNLAVYSNQPFAAVDNDALKSFRNGSVFRDGFHVLVVRPSHQLPVFLPGELHDQRNGFLPAGKIEPLSFNRGTHEAPDQIVLAYESFVGSHDRCLDIFEVIRGAQQDGKARVLRYKTGGRAQRRGVDGA